MGREVVKGTTQGAGGQQGRWSVFRQRRRAIRAAVDRSSQPPKKIHWTKSLGYLMLNNPWFSRSFREFRFWRWDYFIMARAARNLNIRVGSIKKKSEMELCKPKDRFHFPVLWFQMPLKPLNEMHGEKLINRGDWSESILHYENKCKMFSKYVGI